MKDQIIPIVTAIGAVLFSGTAWKFYDAWHKRRIELKKEDKAEGRQTNLQFREFLHKELQEYKHKLNSLEEEAAHYAYARNWAIRRTSHPQSCAPCSCSDLQRASRQIGRVRQVGPPSALRDTSSPR